jgi:hypothetical protein
MKNLILISMIGSLMGGVWGCKSTGSSSAGTKSAAQGEGTEELRDKESLVFSRDLRMRDGALTEVIMKKTGSSTYDISVHTVFVSRQSGETEDQTRDIGSDMRCKFVGTGINCSKDMRPVDGALKEISIQKNDDGTYIVGENTKFVNRQTGKTEESSKVHSDMKLTSVT